MSLTDIIAAHQHVTLNSGVCCSALDCDWRGFDVHAHSAHVAAEIEKARTVTTIEELLELPDGTWVIPFGYAPPHAVRKRRDSFIGTMTVCPAPMMGLPARVLWLPTDEAVGS